MTQDLSCSWSFPPDELSQAEQMRRPREMPRLRTRTDGIHQPDDHPHRLSSDHETFLPTPETKTRLHPFVHSPFMPRHIALLLYIDPLLIFVTKPNRTPSCRWTFFTPCICTLLCTPLRLPPRRLGHLCMHTKDQP